MPRIDHEDSGGPTTSGSKFAAKQFDFMEIFEEARALAKERNSARNIEAIKDACDISETDETEIGPMPSLREKSKQIIDESQSELSQEVDQRDPYFLPISENLALCHGPKPLTALGVDPAGARVATGGFDFDVKMWDFGGMDRTCRPFKVFRPCEEHQIKHLEFSPSGEYLLAISGSAQAQIVSRDGDPVCFTNKGYQYITDPAAAKGHTHGLHWGCWHPFDPSKILTCSQDATLRLWDINDAETVMNDTRIPNHKSVIKPRSAQGRKVIPTTCSFSKDAHIIAAGCQDGSLQMWDTRKPFVNTTQLQRNAHAPNTDITCIAWAWDGRQLGSRATDDTLKLWDARALSKGPVFILRDLPVIFNQCELTFSPNDHIVATAVCAPRADPKGGRVAFYRRDNFKPLGTINSEHGSVVRVVWHHRLNQVFCASSDGTANVYYDTKASHNGAVMCASRQATAATRQRHLGSGEAYVKPYLIMYDEEAVRAARKNKRLLKNPEVESEIAVAAVNAMNQSQRQAAQTLAEEQAKTRVPIREEALGNRVGSLHQYMVQQIVLQKNEAEERAEKDIRGAILRHAEEAKAKPFWTKAYLKTQPNPVFYNPDEEVKKDDTPVWKKQKLA
ncbi:unnamed protein product [Calicophoron daubneyi]|uniref:Uncharacterized protein n=1 Tax=Calicophoron daubneyi TaxID=300641 RepID=A0AAV2TK55_CALDB